MEQPFVGSRTVITTGSGEKIEIISSFGKNRIVSNVHDALIFEQPDEITISTHTYDTKMKEIEAQQRVLEAHQRELEAQQRVLEAQQRVLEAQQRVLEAQQRKHEAQERVKESKNRENETQQKEVDLNK